MAAYLIVDLDRLLKLFNDRSFPVDLQEMAVALRGRAALAAGVPSEQLRAIVVANWPLHREQQPRLEQIFRSARYDLFEARPTTKLPDALHKNYFAKDPEAVGELILVTADGSLMPLIKKVKLSRFARVRVWGLDNPITPKDEEEFGAIFQDLSDLLGIQSRDVALYIDFENIAISLTQAQFLVNMDRLIASFVRQAQAHGHVIKMAAYAPWGNRGALPPLLDSGGQDITGEAQARLAYANIDPVYHLPGKNSADMKIASDVLTHSTSAEAADVYILATGDRDFNEVLNTLTARGKTVIVWGVHGALSRQLSQNPGLSVEYIEEFTNLETYASRSGANSSDELIGGGEVFTPSQWSSVVIQFDRLTAGHGTRTVSDKRLIEQLVEVNAVASEQRGEDLLVQSEALGVLKAVDNTGKLSLNDSHPVVEKTRLIRDRIALRVGNTLSTRGWHYVNYGFLLKGLAMDRELERPGLNRDDQWRSHWIDFLVRENVLVRELTPHHLNPEDLVPVIRMPNGTPLPPPEPEEEPAPLRAPQPPSMTMEQIFPLDGEIAGQRLRPIQLDLTLSGLTGQYPGTAAMLRRIIVSVEQFTSYRKFEWCPLGSLHNRLRPYDTGMTFQSAVEYLIFHNAVIVSEYANPQSNYNTKGISLVLDSAMVRDVLAERDAFIRLLLTLYRKEVLISIQAARDVLASWDHDLWFSIMERENVLNALNGRPGFYSLFRTHHTVVQVAAVSEGADLSNPDAQR
ncbi:MAG: NYN domain-containing protein [Anaerolineae bacterium]|jgi:hypothetical protein|nr:NYN domain-containing protein [Anaerolineae bacterium]